ncbi:MAG: hypothetical protein NT090_23835 [Acidobacteria bacterium]|nr:hypothetical protein [Acidobacteriota bacterium]
MKRFILLVLVLCAVAAAQPTCGLESIRGTYAVSYLGWLTIAQPGAAPVTMSGTILGVMSIGADGKLSGVGAVAGMGPVTDYDVWGTVEIKSDCTGTMRMRVKPKGGQDKGEIEIDRFIFLPEEKVILTTIVDMGPGLYPAMLGTWKRISTYPNAANW